MIATRLAWRIVERNALAYRRYWWIFVATFAEPVLYLFSIGVGVGELVGDLEGPGGRVMSYEAFVAPGMMAAAAMNGAVLDTTFNFFARFKYQGAYTTMLATPIAVNDIAWGEVVWGLLRGTVNATVFLVTMAALGLTTSPWAVLMIPTALLIGLGFGGVGLGATTYMRSFLDFDFVNLATIPLFLFSATFFPLSRYPDGLEAVIRFTPLYQGVVLMRSLAVGEVGWGLLWHAAYLVAMGLAGVAVASRRLRPRLQP